MSFSKDILGYGVPASLIDLGDFCHFKKKRRISIKERICEKDELFGNVLHLWVSHILSLVGCFLDVVSALRALSYHIGCFLKILNRRKIIIIVEIVRIQLILIR